VPSMQLTVGRLFWELDSAETDMKARSETKTFLALPPCSIFGVYSHMKLSQKLKLALEEIRILILGAQILLGSGLRGVFSDRFDGLPAHARYVDGLGLGLLVCVVALLIAPGPYHRIVEQGQDSDGLHHFATVIADLALLPFALALGIGVFIGIEGAFEQDRV